MTGERFKKLLDERIEKIKNTLDAKSLEYSANDDKLHNFKKAARKKNITMEQALDGMLLKHIVSVDDIIETTKHGIFPSKKVIDEKIGDIINYYILLEACFTERNELVEQRGEKVNGIGEATGIGK